LIQPDLALEQFVEGWVADYQTSSEEEEKIHVHELVVFFFRVSLHSHALLPEKPC
jgi:hypothetical protein